MISPSLAPTYSKMLPMTFISINFNIGDWRPSLRSFVLLHLIYARPCDPLLMAYSVYSSMSFLERFAFDGIHKALTL